MVKHYVIKFVSDLRSLCPMVSSTNKTDRHDITEIFLKVALNTITPNPLTQLVLGLRTEVSNLNNLVKQTPSFIRDEGLSV
jgi:hypothetical protein